MIRRPLVLALALALVPAAASAEDLLQTYQLARAGDPQFSAAESTRDATREGAVQARALMLPQLDGSASVNRSFPSGDTVVGDTNGDGIPEVVGREGSTTRTVGVNARQMLFDRSRFTTLEGQRALSRAGDFTLEAAGDSLVTRTSAAYFNVLIAIETLAAAEAQEAALKKQFDFASKRLEVGLAPITDVHEARAQYDSARASTIITRNALADAYQALAEITGTPVATLKGLPKDFQPAMPEGGDAEGWVATALASNPSLQATQEQLAAADADVKTARSAYLPTVYLGGSYNDQDVIGGAASQFGSGGSRGGSLGVTVNVPIFTSGLTSSRVRQSIAQRDTRADQLEQQRRAIVRTTRNAYQSLLAGISEVEARRLALVAAQSAYDASQVGLEVGTRTVLDVLNNQNTLFNAQREYARARYNFLQSRLALEQSAGTLDVADVQDVNRLLTVETPVPLAR